MLGLSWPLWVGSGRFPRVPFLPGIPEPGSAVSWLIFSALLTCIALAALGLAWRFSLGVGLVLLTVLILQDQHRFQPWVYQYGIVSLLLASLEARQGLRLARLWFIALYLHSGLSKLDVAFCDELGPLFLNTLVQPVGLSPSAWHPPWKQAAVLTLPGGEIVVAVLLLVPRLRRWGVAGAWTMHASLLFILGPWGLRQSPIVLVWNVAMMAEVWLLFGPAAATKPDPIKRWTWLALGAEVVFWAGVILPFGERWGWLDAWPAHALYASHTERTAVYLRNDDQDDYPQFLRKHLRPDDLSGWRRLDLTAWSREERGVPVYPAGRACNGVAEALAARYGETGQVRVVQWGRADRWTGRRTRVERIGLEAIRRQGDRYRLNAHPTPEVRPER